MKRLELEYLRNDLEALEQLLADFGADEDDLTRISFERRAEEVRQELQQVKQSFPARAKVALLFGGRPVIGSLAIDASFGADATKDFQNLVAAQMATREGGTRLTKSVRAEAELFLTGTPRGSFGFLLEEMPESGDTEPLTKTKLAEVTETSVRLVASVGQDKAFAELVGESRRHVFSKLKMFFSRLSSAGASLRLVTDENDVRLSDEDVFHAAYELNKTEVSETVVEHFGTLLGLTPETRTFDFQSEDTEELLTGKVVSDVPVEQRMMWSHELSGEMCSARFREVTVTTPAGVYRRYALLGLKRL